MVEQDLAHYSKLVVEGQLFTACQVGTASTKQSRNQKA
jgi:hypothetical protein